MYQFPKKKVHKSFSFSGQIFLCIASPFQGINFSSSYYVCFVYGSVCSFTYYRGLAKCMCFNVTCLFTLENVLVHFVLGCTINFINATKILVQYHIQKNTKRLRHDTCLPEASVNLWSI